MQYPHRLNPDGVVDSICPRCYVTVGSSTSENNLANLEAKHVCDPALLRYYQEAGEHAKKAPQNELHNRSALTSTVWLTGT